MPDTDTAGRTGPWQGDVAGLLGQNVTCRQRACGHKSMNRFLLPRGASAVGEIEGAGSHFWDREIGKLGHEVRLIPPAYVNPFEKR